MQRFYFPEVDLTQKNLIVKDKNIIYQLTKVLRAREGEEIILFDGNTIYDSLYSIESINNREINLIFNKQIDKQGTCLFGINLYQAMPNKLSKLELIIQKGVEVGIDSFTFFPSNRSQKLFLTDKKLERLKKIIIEAVEQSNRNIVPNLIIENNFSSIRVNKNHENLFFHTSELNSNKLNSVNNTNNKKKNIFVGPEGGWDKDEELNFEKLGFKKIYLGKNILRTETTGIVVGFFLNQY